MNRIGTTDRRSYAVINQKLVYWGSKLTYRNAYLLSDSRQELSLFPEIVLFEGCKSAVIGIDHMLIIGIDGSLWGCGSNGNGQLGIGKDIEFSDRPVRIKRLADVVHVATNIYDTVLVFDKNNALYGWATDGLFGLFSGGTRDPYADDIFQPERQSLLPSTLKLKQIELGEQHALALDEEGFVWIWGKQEPKDSPTVFEHIFVNKVDGLKKVVMVSAGLDYSLAVCNDGTVWAWGENDYGRLGDGTTQYRSKPIKLPLDNIVYVNAYSFHSVAIDAQGAVWIWGRNESGQLGNGGFENSYRPIKVHGLPPIVEAKCGLTHTIVMDNSANIWSWGGNCFGQLGTGDRTRRLTPTRLGLSRLL